MHDQCRGPGERQRPPIVSKKHEGTDRTGQKSPSSDHSVGMLTPEGDASREEWTEGMSGQLWVEVVGDIVMARLRGEPTAALLAECQKQVLFLVRDADRGKVLYDTLEMEAPPVDVPWSQRALDEKLGAIKLRRAIVVPNSRLAYLARLAFGEGEYRVFYNDIVAAIKWLSEDGSAA